MPSPRVPYELALTASLFACRDPGPSWPAMIQLRLLNTTNDVVFIRAVGEESFYPGVRDLAPNDSACTTLNAYDDAVAVEVHSVTNPDLVYGTAWIRPLTGAGWRTVASSSGVTVERSSPCS